MVLAAGCNAPTARLGKAEYLDKCQGAWAGQMIGVCYGEPYQFRSNGKPILEAIPPWKPERIAGAARQDDVYVELTFLGAIEKYGLDITGEQAAMVFASTQFPLWHANLYGRMNIQNGIMPPMSGHPKYNRHADDLDFQIESDLFGIIAPGLPAESNRLCDIFGHIMNYGDGVYGGMFVAGMYTEAYFEPNDVAKVIRAGLACLPRQSTYYQCIDDTLRWSLQYPNDWLTTWKLVEARWNDDVDCTPGNPHNIDAKINGAYIVIGLMYGGGDLLKTIEMCTRCGQDADSSTANAGGVIGCMKGFRSFGQEIVSGIPAMADQNFLGTQYSFSNVGQACTRVAETIVRRTGGQVTEDAFIVRRQQPTPPAKVETWPTKHQDVHQPVTDNEVKLWNSAWKQVEVRSAFDGGYLPREYGRTNVLQLMPITPSRAAALESRVTVPQSVQPILAVELASDTQHGDYLVKLFVDGKPAGQAVVRTDDGEFTKQEFNLPADSAGKQVTVRLEFHANDWAVNSAYIRGISVR